MIMFRWEYRRGHAHKAVVDARYKGPQLRTALLRRPHWADETRSHFRARQASPSVRMGIPQIKGLNKGNNFSVDPKPYWGNMKGA